ncbi:MAG: cation:proton antiporter [Deltaproteobacteria bacterium]|nr:cation:proton antiporter [Deltaproteobacteria bacterium]
MAETLVLVALGIALLAGMLATVQLVRGPDAATRAVALDAITLITLPMMVGLALVVGRSIYIDVALVYAILSFLGVVAFARYLDRGI